MKILPIGLFFLAAGLCGIGLGYGTFKYTHPSSQPSPTPLPEIKTPTPIISPTPEASKSASPSATINHPIRKFIITSSNYRFFPTTMKVREGDKVQVTLKNITGLHNISFPDFGAFSPIIDKNQTVEIEFIADQKGTFEYYCGVEDHQQKGMVGKLVVE